MVPDGPSQTQCTPPQAMQTFNRAHPAAVGTVQIMIGLVVFLFGTAMAFDADSLTVYSGFFVWGAVLYITSGSLTVAAGKSLSHYLVSTALAFNAVASVVSLIGVTICTLDIPSQFLFCFDFKNSPDSCTRFASQQMRYFFVLDLLHLLEFVVSVTVAVFACKANCASDRQEQQIALVPTNAAQAPPPVEVPLLSMSPPPPQVVVFPDPQSKMNSGLAEPPPYTLE